MKDHQESFTKKKTWESFWTRKEEISKLLSTLDLFQDQIPAQNSCYVLGSPGNLPKPLCLFICNMGFGKFKSNDTGEALKSAVSNSVTANSVTSLTMCIREGKDESYYYQ